MPGMGHQDFCSRFHQAVELIGARWNGAILQAILAGHRRFGDIRAAVPGLSDTMLAQRLRELEAEGVLARRVLATTPVRVEYHPTAKGEALAAILEAVAAWAESWVDVPSKENKEKMNWQAS